MESALRDALPLALVVTVSPLNIIPAILLLFTSRPLRTASAFLAGFAVGVGSVLVVMIVVANAVGLTGGSGSSSRAATIKLLLGAYLLFAAARKFRRRPRCEDDASLPRWMDGLTSYTPRRALVAGVVVGAANPKNVVVGAAAGVVIAGASLAGSGTVGAATGYVVIASVGVAAPIAVMVALGVRAPAVLERWRTWLTRNNATVMAVLFAVFGMVLIAQGAAAR